MSVLVIDSNLAALILWIGIILTVGSVPIAVWCRGSDRSLRILIVLAALAVLKPMVLWLAWVSDAIGICVTTRFDAVPAHLLSRRVPDLVWQLVVTAVDCLVLMFMALRKTPSSSNQP